MMGEKGLDAVGKLPKGYYIPAPGTARPRPTPLIGLGTSLPYGNVELGEAYSEGRPLSITWDDERQVWRPPGFEPDSDDSSHLFNRYFGQNAVWDEDGHRWIDAKTGEPISYEQ